MDYLVLKFLHVGSMFVATALAVGPSALLYLVARTSDPASINRAFASVTGLFRVGGAAYGLGILFGVIAALTGAVSLTAGWLLLAYVLVGTLIVTNLGFERWARRVEAAVDDPAALDAAVAAPAGVATLSAMVALTLAIVFVMVVKPSLDA